MKKILVVSDSLGTPIHARGIFNFTVGVVQILRQLGHQVFLLVEPPVAGSFVTASSEELKSVHGPGIRRALLSDLIRHFHGDRFRFDWHYGDPSLQRLAENHPAIMNFKLSLDDAKKKSHQIQFDVDRAELGDHGLTHQSQHLALFDGFVSLPNFYSDSFRRAANRLRPPVIDAAGFDHVIVDTPHYLSLDGVSRDNVHYVVHDFIPFYDVSMGYDWRQLFTSKIESTMRCGANAIFNSETTRLHFASIYGPDAVRRHVTIYPPIREEAVEAARSLDRTARSRYMWSIQGNKRRESVEWQRNLANRRGAKARLRHLFKPNPEWNPDLPFFCSVLSDEPRKNVAALVEASKAFIGKANFVVVGQINGDAYMNGRPEKFPNLHFTGYLSDEDKFDLLKTCSAFIFPSRSEGFGIPIVEAATLGAPVICTDIEVFREITYDKAYYFDANRSGDLVRVIQDFQKDVDSARKASMLKQMVDDAFLQDKMASRIEYLLG